MRKSYIITVAVALLLLAEGLDRASAQTLTTLHQFGSSPTDGSEPIRGLVQGSDGYFYGTTAHGRTNFAGVVFQLSVPLNPPANQIAGIELFSVFGDTYAALSIPSVAGETYQLQYTDSMNPADWLDTGDPITSIGGALTLFDLVGVLPSQRFYRAVITP
ncbi:MAG TPA: choice-of-anchor tandem repeat GloVer-containing protein [Verrucomicrobiae bacterium]|nr:choice-of-anchor tandem repeat GloVer-containing protein [Verrucomicrobiae bacterium]